MPATAAALIELSDGHFECLFTQHEFLRQAFDEVHVVCSPTLRARLPFAPRHLHVFEGSSRSWATQTGIRRYLREHRVSHAVLNTAQGKPAAQLALRNLAGGPRLAGLIHDAGKLGHSLNQALISLGVSRYFVVNDFVKARLGGRAEAFYPTLYPAPAAQVAVEKPAGAFWVCVPGQVEFKRRDYRALLDDPGLAALPPQVRFILLGPSHHPAGDGPALEEELARRGLGHRFVRFRDFVDWPTFHAWVSRCDLILPLVHPDPGSQWHSFLKVSGTFNLSFGFQLPMASDGSFRGLDDFEVSSFFYPSRDGICALLARLAADPAALAERRRAIAGHAKLSFDVQARRYLDHLLAP
ncbi:MAG: hypothetical protein QM767_21790 [Anaeromyxobacter sp.]